jgi:hypothetical protein
MRKDQEALRGEALHHDLGKAIRLEHPVHPGDAAVRDPLGHRGPDCLRAQHRHPKTLRAMGDREPLGESDHGMLGDRVGSGADLRQQAGG